MDCARCGLPVPSRQMGDWKRPDVHEPPEDCLEYLMQEVRRLRSNEAEALLRMKRAEGEAVILKGWIKAHAEKLEQLTVENKRLEGDLTEGARFERLVAAVAQNTCNCGRRGLLDPDQHSNWCDYQADYHDFIEMTEG